MSEEIKQEETTKETTQEAVLTQEAVETWLGTEEGKKFLQPKLDSYHTKGLQSWQEKNLDKIKSEAVEQLKADTSKQLEELNGQIKANTINTKFKDGLLKNGMRADKLELALKLADTSKLSLDGDNLLGANDLMAKLQNDVPEFFGEVKTSTNTAGEPARQGQPAGTTTEDDGIAAMRKAAGLL